MRFRFPAFLLALALTAGGARAEDLVQIYRDAQQNDPTLAAARANWTATQERVPQARSGLLPSVSAAGTVNANEGRSTTYGDPRFVSSNVFGSSNFSISAAQPLYRAQNVVALNQAQRLVEQADYTLAASQQDLIIRVTVAYFDVLLAEVNVTLAETQKAAVSEQLAQAKRNFEVGVATITDTNEAQARYDSIVAQEIIARNDLDNRRTALRTIIGRMPRELKKLGPGFEPTLPEPNVLDPWIERALTDNLSVKIAGYNFDVASLEIDRARAAHLPTVDLVAGASHSLAIRVARQRRELAGAHDADRPGVQLPDLPGRLRQLAGPRVDRAAGNRAPEPGGRAPRRRGERADRLLRREQRRRVGDRVRAGAALGADGAGVEPARPRGRRPHEPRRAERHATAVRRAARPRAVVLQLPDQPAAPQGVGRGADRAGPRGHQSAAAGGSDASVAHRSAAAARGDRRVARATLRDARRQPRPQPLRRPAMRSDERQRRIAHRRARGRVVQKRTDLGEQRIRIRARAAPRRPRSRAR